MTGHLQSSARRLGLGRAAYRLWHQPAGFLGKLFADGGPWEQRRSRRGRRAMEAAAATLPPPERASGAPLELHVLTGARFYYQTAFCLHSFARHSGRPLNPVIYDDGSLASSHRGALTRVFPQARIVSRDEAAERRDRHLPRDRHPVLCERWDNYPHLRKLTDPHLGSAGWKLVIDSDLLFFRRPEFLLTWMDRPQQPLHAVDCEECYGYPRPLLERLAGAPLGRKVNVGLCGLRSDALDWAEIEAWCAELLRPGRPSYFLEQALVAMLTARQACAIAPAEDYLTNPARAEVAAPRGVMHHYVAGSKRWYFQMGWHHAVPAFSPAP